MMKACGVPMNTIERIYEQRGKYRYLTFFLSSLAKLNHQQSLSCQHVLSRGYVCLNLCFIYLKIMTKLHFYLLRMTGFER